MLHPLIRMVVKVAIASLIVGTILAHFGITADHLVREFGLSFERIEELARRGFAWALPNLLLGAMVIVPVWFLLYLFGRRGAATGRIRCRNGPCAERAVEVAVPR